MMSHNFKERYGSTALIAGASEGLGFAFAEALAAEGLNLILVARREDVLTLSAAILRKKYRVQVTEIVCDLGDTSALEKVSQRTSHFDIDFLVYNAAMSAIGPYLEQDITVHERIVTVNMLSPLRFIYQAGKKMVGRRKGGIILMSSMAGFQGSGFLATYASSKAFLRILAEGLWYEWKDKGVDIITCCAGATATPGFARTNPGKISFLAPRPQLPDEVVKECMRKLGKVPSFISGHGNKLAAFFMNHLFSRNRAVTVMGDTTRRMYHVRY